MSSFSYLPEELIERICESLRWATNQNDAAFRQTLCNLCLTSKTYDRIARPLLYRCVDLNDDDLVRFAKTVIGKQELANLVISASLNLKGFDVSCSLPDVYYIRNHVCKDDTYETSEVERMRGEGNFWSTNLFWTVVIECILIRLIHVQTLRLAWDLGADVELFSYSRMRHVPITILPSLRSIAYYGIEGRGNIRNLNKIIMCSKLQSLSIIGCQSFEFQRLRDPLIGKFATVHHLNFINCSWLIPSHLQELVAAFPNLKSFRWFAQDLDEVIFSPVLTATDLVGALFPLRTKLENLAITTSSMGDDDGFPNLQAFAALEDLRVNAFELADYDEDTDSDSDSSSWDTDLEEDIHLVGTAPISAASTGVTGSSTSQTHSDTESSSETDGDTTSSSDTDSPCKPVLHLLPRCLQTLWIDEIDSLDGGLQEQLLTLASTAHDEFPNLKKVTVESEHEDLVLRNAFSTAGIEFVRMKTGHDWFVELGLDSYLPQGSDEEGHSDQEEESVTSNLAASLYQQTSHEWPISPTLF